MLPIWPAPSGHFLTSDFVDEVHYNIVLLYSEAIKVLPDSFCQIIFALPLGLHFSNHGWGVLTDAAGTRKNSLMKRASKGSRGG